jgi:hypothetical protein
LLLVIKKGKYCITNGCIYKLPTDALKNNLALG